MLSRAWFDKLTMREGEDRREPDLATLAIGLQPNHIPHGELVEPRTIAMQIQPCPYAAAISPP